MAITLAQAKLNSQDDIQKGVIDEFQKSSFILNNITFDDVVSPGSVEGSLTYGYQRLLTEAGAAFRALNSEYTPSEAQKERKVTDLKIFGGSFEIDRVLTNTGGLVSAVQFQLNQKIKSARALFHDATINGDEAANADQFDGLDVAVTGSDTEANTGDFIDLSSTSAVDSNYKVFLDEIENWLADLDELPSVIAGNSKSITKFKQVARRAGYLTASEDAFGRQVEAFNNIPIIDLGAKPASTSPIVDIYSKSFDGGTTTTTGLTDLYAFRFGMDAFHGASLAGQPLVNTYFPDFTSPGAVKSGEVELVASIALKKQKSAGVFRNLKVQ
jgi:hypothetical protein